MSAANLVPIRSLLRMISCFLKSIDSVFFVREYNLEFIGWEKLRFIFLHVNCCLHYMRRGGWMDQATYCQIYFKRLREIPLLFISTLLSPQMRNTLEFGIAHIISPQHLQYVYKWKWDNQWHVEIKPTFPEAAKGHICVMQDSKTSKSLTVDDNKDRLLPYTAQVDSTPHFFQNQRNVRYY